MKKIIPLLFVCHLLLFTSCEEKCHDPQPQPEKGYASGKAVDTQGNPLANVEIVVNNTQFYNHNILGTTDAKGQYKLQLTPGSWYVRGTIRKTYEGLNYVLDLHPETEGAFAGTEGAVRNLQWKLTGAQPTEFGGSGYYGGSMEVVGYGAFANTDDVEVRLEPVTPLIDGSTGQTLTRDTEGYMIQDIPLGKYKITARAASENRDLRVRLRNKDLPFGTTTTGLFEPAYQGATGRYKMTIEVSY